MNLQVTVSNVEVIVENSVTVRNVAIAVQQRANISITVNPNPRYTIVGVEEAPVDGKVYGRKDKTWIEAGEAQADFQLSVTKADCEFKGDWIKIAHTEATNAKRVIVRRATVEDSNGEQELDLIVAYPAAETYTGANIYQGFYIQDRNGLLSKTADWDVLNFAYDVENDTQTKYSFLHHETGVNVICSHRKDYYISEQDKDTGNEMHAMSMRCMFTSVFPEFKGDYIDTYTDPDANYSSIPTAFEPTYYEKKRACILMRPYTYAALAENYSSSADFLEIGSHSDNARNGNPPFRVDITPKADVFLSHSIAVGAKKENDWQTAPQTTYGYGVEFFEITEMSYLEAQYTERGERIYPHIALQLWSNADRTVVWTNNSTHQDFINSFPDCFKVGDIVFINVPLEAPTFGGTHPAEWTFVYNPASVKRTITAIETIDGVTYFTLDGAIWDTQLNGNKYLWAFTPAAYTAGNVNGSTQSPATMIVGAKFAKIKQVTGLGLRLIREACRATAVLVNDTTATSQSYSGATTSVNVADTSAFPDEGIIRVNGYDFVYTSKTASSFVGESQSVLCGSGATVTLKWDMWRGFGQIDVQAAIAYLEDNYLNNDNYKATVQRPKVNPALTYEDLGERDCVPKGLIPTIQGDPGRGIASIDLTNTTGKVKTYTITFTDDTTTTFTVLDGNDGASPVITFVGTTIYVNGVAGPDLKGATGKSQYQSYLDTTSDNPPLSEAEWARPWDGVFRESILLSVRKIGVINKAFRLRRSSDNNEQDIYFDVNGEISDNSLCENGQTFLVWKGVDTLSVLIWYNQSVAGIYDAYAHTEWNPITGVANNCPIFENGYVKFLNNAGMALSNVFEVKKEYRRFTITQNKRISENTSGAVFLEYWGNFVSNSYLHMFLNGSYSVVEGGSVTYNCPSNVFVLINEKQVIGGSKGGDNNQSHFTRINGIDVTVNKNRDGQTINRLFMITGGKANDNETLRKEFRIYNYDPSNHLDIEAEMKSYFNL